MTEKKGIHRAWIVMIGTCMLYGGTIGLLGNTAGIFIRPVVNEMGWTWKEATFYMTIMPLVAAVFQLVAGRLIVKLNFRILMSIIVTMFSLAYIATSQVSTVLGWNIYGVVYGIAFGFLAYLPVPILINNWFKMSVGLALGIAVASVSIVAAICNPIGSWLITEYGWRTTRIIFGAASWVMVMPFLLFVIHRSPSEYRPQTLRF